MLSLTQMAVDSCAQPASQFLVQACSNVHCRETNGQAAVLILRDGVPIGLTIDASTQGINEIMWFLRPSKLAGISKSNKK